MRTPLSRRSAKPAATETGKVAGVPKLFHLRCSPRAASESSAGAAAFVARFREARPSWDIDVMDIWRERLPEFDGDAMEAKYARLGGPAFSDAHRKPFPPLRRIAVPSAPADRA